MHCTSFGGDKPLKISLLKHRSTYGRQAWKQSQRHNFHHVPPYLAGGVGDESEERILPHIKEVHVWEEGG